MALNTDIIKLLSGSSIGESLSPIRISSTTQAILQLSAGTELSAQVMGVLANRNTIVRIAGELLEMELPNVYKSGDSIPLTYIGNDPRPTFLLSRQDLTSAPVNLSTLGRMLSQISQDENEQPAIQTNPLNKGARLLETPPLDTAGLADRLREVFSKSGLFYEAHLSQWTAGKRPLADILQEPQAGIPGKVPLTLGPDQRVTPSPNDQTGRELRLMDSGKEIPPGTPLPMKEPAKTNSGDIPSKLSGTDVSKTLLPNEVPKSSESKSASPPNIQSPGTESHTNEGQNVNLQNKMDLSENGLNLPLKNGEPERIIASGTHEKDNVKTDDKTAPEAMPNSKSRPDSLTTHTDQTAVRLRDVYQVKSSMPESLPTAPNPRESPPADLLLQVNSSTPEKPQTLHAEQGVQLRMTTENPKQNEVPQRLVEPQEQTPLPNDSKTVHSAHITESVVQNDKTLTPAVSMSAEQMQKTTGEHFSKELAAPQTFPLIRQQLDALNTGQFVWQGEAWPGQQLQWAIDDQEARNCKSPEDASWKTSLKIDLPNIGAVRADLRITGSSLQLQFKAETESTRKLMQTKTESLSLALENAGLRLVSLDIKNV